MQKMIENGVTVLTAGEGMMLTDGESFGRTVRLGCNASESDWQEVSEAEAEAMQTADEEVSSEDALAELMEVLA